MSERRNPWRWIPSLYFAEGFPYILITTVSVIMYKGLGISNAEIAFYTSWLYLPWVIKPIWSPILELKSNKRQWFLMMQFLGACSFFLIGFFLTLPSYFYLTLLVFWVAAFWSATHDIAADGFYMLGLTEKQQSFYIGIRSTFYRLAMIGGQGGIVILAGQLEKQFGDLQKAWSVSLFICAAIMMLLVIINWMGAPKVEEKEKVQGGLSGIKEVFASFFRKENIGISLAFLLTYRLGESQLVKIASPFLLDAQSAGGLGLTTTEVGALYGTFGWIALSIGGILGGYLISRHGLGKWIWPMAIAINAPNILYLILSKYTEVSIGWISAVVVIEQFGYGFGFTSYLLFTVFLAEGISKTAHYAIATGFMALGMMIPGMVSGFIQEYLGYDGFFIWVVVAGLPGFYFIKRLSFPRNFGLKA